MAQKLEWHGGTATERVITEKVNQAVSTLPSGGGYVAGDNIAITDNTDGTKTISASSKASTDYNSATNKPQIESVELVGNKTFSQLGMEVMSVQDIEKILYLD